MGYTITQQFIHHNRSYEPLIPIGLILHDTETLNATAQNEQAYFDSAERDASAHFFVDWTQIIQTIPENEVAWHAFNYANHHFLSIELCTINDPNQFQEAYKRYIWLAAYLCNKYHWNPDEDVHSHKWVSEHYEGDHVDPIPWLAKWGISWDKVIADIKEELSKMQIPTKDVDLWRYVGVEALNVRSGPDTSYPVRYVLKYGQKIHLSKLQDGGSWGFTTYGDLGGWLDCRYLRVEDPNAPAPAPAPTPAPQPQKPTKDELISQAEKQIQDLQKTIEQLKGV
jgi:hypothetical protein